MPYPPVFVSVSRLFSFLFLQHVHVEAVAHGMNPIPYPPVFVSGLAVAHPRSGRVHTPRK